MAGLCFPSPSARTHVVSITVPVTGPVVYCSIGWRRAQCVQTLFLALMWWIHRHTGFSPPRTVTFPPPLPATSVNWRRCCCLLHGKGPSVRRTEHVQSPGQTCCSGSDKKHSEPRTKSFSAPDQRLRWLFKRGSVARTKTLQWLRLTSFSASDRTHELQLRGQAGFSGSE